MILFLSVYECPVHFSLDVASQNSPVEFSSVEFLVQFSGVFLFNSVEFFGSVQRSFRLLFGSEII